MALIQPYLFFDGRCEEAIGFYQRALGAELAMMMRNSDAPPGALPPGMPAGSENKVMHATLNLGGGVLMASDGMAADGANFKGFALSLSYATEAECRQRFDALADGGRVDMPLGKTFWSAAFGMVTDRFGVPWMVSLDH